MSGELGLRAHLRLGFGRGESQPSSLPSLRFPRSYSCCGVLLEGDDHGVWTNEVLDISFAEACLFHPADAIGAGVIEAAGGFDEHVEAHHEAERVLGTVVVDERVVDDEGSAGIERVVSLADEHLLLFKVPVVQDVAHGENVDAGQGLGEEVSRLEAEAAVDGVSFGVLLEDWSALSEVVANAVKMRVGEGDLDGEIALCGSDVGVGLVF